MIYKKVPTPCRWCIHATWDTVEDYSRLECDCSLPIESGRKWAGDRCPVFDINPSVPTDPPSYRPYNPTARNPSLGQSIRQNRLVVALVYPLDLALLALLLPYVWLISRRQSTRATYGLEYKKNPEG